MYNCPMCSERTATAKGDCHYVECVLCKGVYIDSRLVRAPSTLSNWPELLAASRELRQVCDWPATIHFDGAVTAPTAGDRSIAIQRLPRTIKERADRLLQSLVAQTLYFGAKVKITYQVDYPLAYASRVEELNPFLEYLQQQGLIELGAYHSGVMKVNVTAHGFEVVNDAKLLDPITVFISSTCYDLRDCRSELSSHLESLGCQVRVSDEPTKFEVSPTIDSIESCLLNVANSDAVFAIIDQRYGPPLKEGDYTGISATHAEVRYAQQK